MSVETVLMLDAAEHEAQGVADAIANFDALLPPALVGDAMSGESKTGGGDAGGVALVGALGVAAVFDQAGNRIGFVPEELETGSFDVFEKLVFIASETILGGIVFKKRRALGGVLGWLSALRSWLGSLLQIRNQISGGDEGYPWSEFGKLAQPGAARG